MAFAGVNYIAILIAAVAAFAFGALWYGVLFSKAWVAAARLKPEEMKPSPVPFIITFVLQLLMAWVLAGVIGHLGDGQVTLWNGIVSGAFVWLGFMITTMTVNHRYQGFGWNLTIIDGLHWLGVALIMGAAIGWWGV